MNVALLQVRGATKRFGGLVALGGVDLVVNAGEVYGLIGPNGAGKTTFFNVITGLYPPDEGRFELGGKPYEPAQVHRVAMSGIARTFQNIRLFGEMSAAENVMVGCHVRTRSGVLGAMLGTRSFHAEERATRALALALLERVGLERCADDVARTLSYGDQRRLEIARALASRPKLLALDEPAAGMNATEKLQLRDLLRKIRQEGTTLLLIEHDVKLVMGLCDRVSVLENGRMLASGTPAEVQRHPEVVRAYLGSSEHAA
jgi:branched-chain amino acid transport system ATP-binding protein